MGYGFTVKNNSGYEVIDGSNPTYKLHSEGSIYTMRNGIRPTVSLPSTDALIYFRPNTFSTSDVYSAGVFKDSPYTSNNLLATFFAINSNTSPALTRIVHYKILVPVENGDVASTGYGLNVFNSSGNLIVSSDNARNMPITQSVDISHGVPYVSQTINVNLDNTKQYYALANSLSSYYLYYPAYNWNQGEIYAGVRFYSSTLLQVTNTMYTVGTTPYFQQLKVTIGEFT